MLILRAMRHVCDQCALPSVLACVLLLAPATPATGLARQDPAPEANAPTVLRVETRLVQVDVVVRDDDGLVTDLTIEDFLLYADGEEREIEVFEVTRVNAREPADTNAAPDAPEVGLGPGERVSNRPVGRDDEPASATILLLDLLNMRVMDQARANAQVLEFVESLDGRHEVAIYELRAGLRRVLDYTKDRDELVRAATFLGTEFSSQLEGSDGEPVTGSLESGPGEPGLQPNGVSQRITGPEGLAEMVAEYYVNSRMRTTSTALETLANHMARLPGRKNIVWLSADFPFSFEPHTDFKFGTVSSGTVKRLERTARVLTDANVAVYPISVVGLAPGASSPGFFNEPSLPGGASAEDASRFAFSRGVARSRVQSVWNPENAYAMRQIARMTGGEASYLTNGIAEAIGDSIDDTELIYTLGFYPDSASVDREFHELRVSVARDDVDVRHRRGYYGFGAPDLPDEDRTVPMLDLVTSPINATEIGLTARTTPETSGEVDSVTRLLVDLNDLNLEFRDSAWVGTLEIATVFVEADVDEPGISSVLLDITLTDGQYADAVQAGGYELLSLTSVQAGEAWLRVVVREPTSGRTGSLWVALD